MVDVIYLASALITGLFLLAVVAVVARNERWRVYDSSSDEEPLPRLDALIDGSTKWGRNPWSWTLLFVLLTAGLTASVLLYVGGGPVPEGSQRIVGLVIAGFFLLLVSGFLFVGMYIMAKSKGRSNAWGVAEGIFALGVVFIGAIVLTLLTG